MGSGFGFRLHRYTGFGGFIPTFLVYGICDRFPEKLTATGFCGLFRADWVVIKDHPAFPWAVSIRVTVVAPTVGSAVRSERRPEGSGWLQDWFVLTYGFLYGFYMNVDIKILFAVYWNRIQQRQRPG